MRPMFGVFASSGVLVALAALAFQAGCSADYPEWKIACSRDRDCPEGMSCQANGRCARGPASESGGPSGRSSGASGRTSSSPGDAAAAGEPATGSAGVNRAGAGAPPRADAGAGDRRDAGAGLTGRCRVDNGGCDALVACLEISGLVSCGACPAGYIDVRGDGTRCEDIDECQATPKPCGPGAICTNGPGAYTCEACPAGGVSAPGGECAQSAPPRLGTDLDDTGFGLAIDAQGAVVVAGSTRGAFEGMNAGGLDAFVAKLDASGGVAWVRQFGGPEDDEASSVVVDERGDVYVAGFTSGVQRIGPMPQRAFVAKLGPGGERMWMREVEAGPSRATGLIVDADGGGIMAGESSSWGQAGLSDLDLLFVRFAADGSFESIETNGTDEDDWSASLVRGSSSFYVAGATAGSMDDADNEGGADLLVLKVDQQYFEPIWSAQLGSFARDEATRVCVDAEWNAYVVGNSSGPLEDTEAVGEEDVLLARFERDGELGWIQRIGTPQSDVGYDVVASADGTLYVAGLTLGSLASDNRGGADGFVAKYDLDGAELWSRQFGGEADDGVRAAALDRQGVIWLLVNSASTWAGVPTSGGTDIYLVRFDPKGLQL